MKTMKREHTLASIATEMNCNKRTVQLWMQRYKKETDPERTIGELIGGVRHFSDDERLALISYGGKVEPSEFIQEVEVEAVEQVAMIVPTSFNPMAAIAKFDGVVGKATDPDQILHIASAVIDAAKNCLDNKIEQQKTELNAHEAARGKLQDMRYEGITDLKIKASESRRLAEQQDKSTASLQSMLQELMALGKQENAE